MSKIVRIKSTDIPEELLLLADEDPGQIDAYRQSAVFYGYVIEDLLAGIVGCLHVSNSTREIVSLAVLPEFQHQGAGTSLLEFVIQQARDDGIRTLGVATADSSIHQLSLYQACGFRISSIQKNYFTQHYSRPVIEHGLLSRHKIVLEYTIYPEETLDLIITSYWDKFVQTHPEYSNRPFDAWALGFGERMNNSLLALVKLGIKTGTSSAYELYETGEPIPQVGDVSILTFGSGLPGCIIENTGVSIHAFDKITAAQAKLEGEGDLSLEYWREVHELFFKNEYKHQRRRFRADIPVLFEEFTLLYNKDVDI